MRGSEGLKVEDGCHRCGGEEGDGRDVGLGAA